MAFLSTFGRKTSEKRESARSAPAVGTQELCTHVYLARNPPKDTASIKGIYLQFFRKKLHTIHRQTPVHSSRPRILDFPDLEEI